MDDLLSTMLGGPVRKAVINRLTRTMFKWALSRHAESHYDSPEIGVDYTLALFDRTVTTPHIAVFNSYHDYRQGYRPARDALLVIEVSHPVYKDTHGTPEKLPLYARSGVPQVWLLNLIEERMEVYSEPSGKGRYRSREVIGLEATLAREVGSLGAVEIDLKNLLQGLPVLESRLNRKQMVNLFPAVCGA